MPTCLVFRWIQFSSFYYSDSDCFYTVRIQKLDIQNPEIQNPNILEVSLWMVPVSNGRKYSPDHLKTNIYKKDYLVSLNHLIYKEKLCFYIKRSRLMDHLKTGQNASYSVLTIWKSTIGKLDHLGPVLLLNIQNLDMSWFRIHTMFYWWSNVYLILRFLQNSISPILS